MDILFIWHDNSISVIFRAILKPVYWFGVQNSDPQSFKSVNFWCKLLSPFVVAEPWGQCFELFRMQNSQTFLRLHPWTPLPSCTTATVFLLYTLVEKLAPPTPPKKKLDSTQSMLQTNQNLHTWSFHLSCKTVWCNVEKSLTRVKVTL